MTVITSLQTSEKRLSYMGPSNSWPSVTSQVCRRQKVVVTQNPSSSSTSTIKSGHDEFARHDTFGNPFSLIAVKQVTWVCVSRSLGHSCQDHVSDKAQPKPLHLHCISRGREVSRWHLTLLFRPWKVKLDKPQPNEAVCSWGWGSTKPFQLAVKWWHEAVRDQFSV